jgi:plasmid stability protein
MAKMIQLRNVPDELHRLLKSRAALAGMSLSDYLLREIQHAAARPSTEELMRRLESRRPVKTSVSPARAVREERDRR